jgi:hypothetical protein
MKTLKKYTKLTAVVAAAAVVFSACNKDLDRFADPVAPIAPVSSSTISASLAANPNDSLFRRLLLQSGLDSMLANNAQKFTVFATDNNGMKLLINGLSNGAVPVAAPDAVHSGFITSFISQATAASLIRHVIIGQQYTSADFPVGAPNFPLPTLLQLDPINTPFLRSTLCIDKGTPVSYVNNLPIISVDQQASNGVIHRTFSLVTALTDPNRPMVKNLIAADATLTYFAAAVARGDVGSTGLGRLDSLMNYAPLNMTVLAPNNTAMIATLKGLAFSTRFKATYDSAVSPTGPAGHVQLSAAAAVAFANTNTPPRVAQANLAIDAGPTTALSIFPIADVRGIVAYHMLARDTGSRTAPAIRLFGNNISAAPALTAVNTLLNSSIAIHPGIRATAVFPAGSPVPSSVSIIGLGPLSNLPSVANPTGSSNAPFSGTAANVTGANRSAINGVLHVIDRVLIPN